MGEIRTFRDLDAWSAAMDLVTATYEVARVLPASEQFGLRAQMQRAAVSVPSNIAEGHAGGSGRRYRNFVRIALGSIAELDTQLELALRLKYIDSEKFTQLARQLTRLVSCCTVFTGHFAQSSPSRRSHLRPCLGAAARSCFRDLETGCLDSLRSRVAFISWLGPRPCTGRAVIFAHAPPRRSVFQLRSRVRRVSALATHPFPRRVLR